VKPGGGSTSIHKGVPEEKKKKNKKKKTKKKKKKYDRPRVVA